jgi:enoyl-CoA hydratase/carnithine racemase
MSEHIKLAREGAVLCITFARADKKNALTGAMYNALIEAFDQADGDSAIRVMLISGEGGNFSAGNDINDFLSSGAFNEDFPALRFIRRLAICETPIVAAVEGNAIGVGTTMLFHCDLVYATAGARLQMPFVNLALVPEAASSLLVPRRVGPQKAAELLMLGEPMDGTEAHRVGLVNAVVTPEKLYAHAMERAQTLASKPRNAVATTRRLIRGDPDELLARIDLEAQEFNKAMNSQEARDVFMAFLARGKK